VIFILASNSPRRKELLALSGCEFQVFPAALDEDLLPGEAAENYVRRLAEEKARAAAASLSRASGQAAARVIIAADTTVVDPQAEPGAEILAKPQDAEEAEAMLIRLHGRTHQVYTGIAVLDVDADQLRSAVCCTDVKMRPYGAAEIQAYIESGDPFDKAGGYAIQNSVFQPVESITGCYANVVGLPLCSLTSLLQELSLPLPPHLPEACQADLLAPEPVFRQIYGRPAPIPGI
jgi:septum formation protein